MTNSPCPPLAAFPLDSARRHSPPRVWISRLSRGGSRPSHLLPPGLIHVIHPATALIRAPFQKASARIAVAQSCIVPPVQRWPVFMGARDITSREPVLVLLRPRVLGVGSAPWKLLPSRPCLVLGACGGSLFILLYFLFLLRLPRSTEGHGTGGGVGSVIICCYYQKAFLMYVFL